MLLVALQPRLHLIIVARPPLQQLALVVLRLQALFPGIRQLYASIQEDQAELLVVGRQLMRQGDQQRARDLALSSHRRPVIGGWQTMIVFSILLLLFDLVHLRSFAHPIKVALRLSLLQTLPMLAHQRAGVQAKALPAP